MGISSSPVGCTAFVPLDGVSSESSCHLGFRQSQVDYVVYVTELLVIQQYT